MNIRIKRLTDNLIDLYNDNLVPPMGESNIHSRRTRVKAILGKTILGNRERFLYFGAKEIKPPSLTKRTTPTPSPPPPLLPLDGREKYKSSRLKLH